MWPTYRNKVKDEDLERHEKSQMIDGAKWEAVKGVPVHRPHKSNRATVRVLFDRNVGGMTYDTAWLVGACLDPDCIRGGTMSLPHAPLMWEGRIPNDLNLASKYNNNLIVARRIELTHQEKMRARHLAMVE